MPVVGGDVDSGQQVRGFQLGADLLPLGVVLQPAQLVIEERRAVHALAEAVIPAPARS
ncbi:hypothetical protein [Flexivirga caeni]|uniref:hypothetical protein n=1 Tax=Flexivirga caeni TaxID=2294115 RepID=UPI001FE32B08|nr:hypothetical protein [Flexivirga caeni]